MKTFEQFKEDVNKIDTGKILNTFKSNPNIQNLLKNMEGGNINVNDMKKITKDKKFTTDVKNQGIEVIQQGANMLVNKLTTNLKNLGK